MKSVLSEMVTFGALQARLIAFVNMRIQNGEYTERGLARLLGISQPQIHHVLKGTRRLQPEFADRIMARFGITVLNLLQDAELISELHSRQSEMADLRWYSAGRMEQETPLGSGEFTRRRKPVGRSFSSLVRTKIAG